MNDPLPEHGREEAPKAQTGRWRATLVSDTLIISLAAVILYFWGIIYYMQLAESFGFGVSLFSIPVYEVMTAPWDNAVITLVWGGCLWAFWGQRSLWVIVIIYLVFGIVALVRLPLKLLRLDKKLQEGLAILRHRLAKPLGNLKAKIPDVFWRDLDEQFEQKSTSPFIFVTIVVTILSVGLSMSPKAIKRVAAYNALERKPRVEVLCSDGVLLKGFYVAPIGDGLLVDVTENGQFKRVLLRGTGINRITRVFDNAPVSPGAPKDVKPEPPPSAAAASNTTGK